ncbi:LysR substrate-binding domain-containing protein [Bacillus subtilis]|uniref:LysR substrate-binding domain-containing protein n=1 Tax=Bacillus subtilis TaxID=1423 RepID=UPI00196B40B4|nr:LysR substrate-binding domain-containing protein [Bacillus subtilis]
MGRDVDDERLLSIPLRDDPMLAFVARNHPWAGREFIELADLDDTPLVLRETGSVTRQTLEREMHQAGLRIRPAIQVEGREAAREAVVVGIGVGVVSASEFGADSRVYAMPIRDCTQRMKETLVIQMSMDDSFVDRFEKAFILPPSFPYTCHSPFSEVYTQDIPRSHQK